MLRGLRIDSLQHRAGRIVRPVTRRRLVTGTLSVAFVGVSGIALALAISPSPPSVPEIETDASPMAGAAVTRQRMVARNVAANLALAGAPWIVGAHGEPVTTRPARPGLVFPKGTSFADALTALYDSVYTHGGLPVGTRLTPQPSPRTVVTFVDASTGERVVSLLAPWGFDEKGLTRLPVVILPASMTRAEVHRVTMAAAAAGGVPAGAVVETPPLTPCQGAQVSHAPSGCPIS